MLNKLSHKDKRFSRHIVMNGQIVVNNKKDYKKPINKYALRLGSIYEMTQDYTEELPDKYKKEASRLDKEFQNICQKKESER